MNPQRLAIIKLLVLDFDGVLTTNKVWTFADGSEAVECSRADGIGIERVKKLGVQVFVLSGETNRIVEARCKKLGLTYASAIVNKLQFLQYYAVSFLGAGRNWEKQTAYVGNDINDLECLKAVGVPIITQDAEPALLKEFRVKDWQSDSGQHHYYEAYPNELFIITRRSGGEGAVREVCDLIADAIEAVPPQLKVTSHYVEGWLSKIPSFVEDYSA